MENVKFSSKTPEEIIKKNKKIILSFFNLHNIWWIKNNNLHKKILNKYPLYLFPDGRIISRFLHIKQERGPAFIKRFLKCKAARQKKHFFIGVEKEEIKTLSKISKISEQKISSYHSDLTRNPRILILPNQEISNLSKLINRFNPDFLWIGISSPKQEFIASQLFSKIKAKYIICIGAGKDFFLGKKKEAPKIFGDIGLEWFYRLVTDFKHSKTKVRRSFQALFYILTNEIKLSK